MSDQSKQESVVILGSPVQKASPITAVSTSRYSCRSLIGPTHHTVTLGSRSLTPGYLPRGWSSHINPEGQTYFFGTIPLRVVTEERLHVQEVLDKICKWIIYFAELLKEREIQGIDSVELYLELSSEGCLYYLVDHSSRREFWLEDVSTEALGLPQADSPAHLGYVLEEHYWTHVEHFPMHSGGIPRSILDDLRAIFVQGSIDQLTSNCSPFPYPPQDCKKFIKLLKLPRDSELVTDGNLIFTVARLWSVISGHRFNIHYGGEQPKFSREQSTLDSPRSSRFLTRSISCILWRIPEVYINKLDKIYDDNIVYADHWRMFMSRCIDDWQATTTWSLGFLMTNTLLLLNFSYRLPLGSVSLLLCVGSILSAIGLSMYHHDQREAVSAEAAAYLDNVQSDRWGFDLIGTLYSLPKALFVWALVLFAVQSTMLAFRLDGLRAALAITCGVVCVAKVSRRYLDGSVAWCPDLAWSKFFGPSAKQTEDQLPI
ncbi:hypothetical protein NEOLEDRAFT_1133215 [Neolentinus lepideus HHB14362 ss-1]|uniref:WW domain-containing protein n=1 Tax=Neolentinus lepideus HHB14362 ss-1 TaxID=1314782 RepID=A0A165SUJ2_9AGAM|nr:hypothetical protein NEOLEDRAFT_1133215 [Neolentinus lepideus HHB14362 ss-1]